MVNVFKVSTGETLLFSSLSKDAAISFAQLYYSKSKTICNIDEFRYQPKDHRVPHHT